MYKMILISSIAIYYPYIATIWLPWLTSIKSCVMVDYNTQTNTAEDSLTAMIGISLLLNDPCN